MIAESESHGLPITVLLRQRLDCSILYIYHIKEEEGALRESNQRTRENKIEVVNWNQRGKDDLCIPKIQITLCQKKKQKQITQKKKNGYCQKKYRERIYITVIKKREEIFFHHEEKRWSNWKQWDAEWMILIGW